MLLVDKTGSMGGELANVKANVSSIVSQVQGIQPDAQFAVAAYCDFGDPAPAFQLFTDLTGNATALATAINNVNLCGGGDDPEAQLNALWEIGDGGDAVTFRPDSSRIVVWYGDKPGHDPSGGHTEANAMQSLVDVEAKVLAISTGAANNLDGTDQATRITNATGGDLLSGVAAGDVSDATLAGLQNLDVTVAGSPSCDPGLSIALSPASQTVQDGFFRMVASDNVDDSVPIYIKDLGSGTVFGPYPQDDVQAHPSAPRRSRRSSSPASSSGSSPSRVTPS